MKNALLILLVVGTGTCAAFGQSPVNSASPAAGQRIAPNRPGTATAATASQPSTQGAAWINLGTGELIAPEPGAGTQPVSPNRVQPPATLALTNRSSISPVQFQNINRLEVDLNGLSIPGRDLAEQERTLVQNLKAAPLAQERPPAASISQLGSTLARVMPTLNLTAVQRRQLAIDLNLALNSARLTQVEAERVLADARSVLQPGTVNNAQGVQDLMGNLAALVSNLQAKNGREGQTNQLNSAVEPSGRTPPQVGQAGQVQTGQGAGRSASESEQPPR